MSSTNDIPTPGPAPTALALPYRYMLAGIAFGVVFPILATLIRIAEFNLGLSFPVILRAHASDRLLWIIDTAPLFLGLFAFLVGQRQSRLQTLNTELADRETKLHDVQRELERRVNESTGELLFANQKITQRAEQLEWVADFSRSAISIQQLQQLLEFIVRVVGERFNFPDVAIFLLDDQRQYAVLTASSSPAGQELIKAGYRLRAAAPGIIGYAVQSAQPSTTLDIRAMYPDLRSTADTGSAIALPLMAGNTVLGILLIQTSQSNAFPQDDVPTLSILADQTAVSIQNVVVHETARRALTEAESMSKRVSGRVWKGYTQGRSHYGYRFDGVKAQPLKDSSVSTEGINELQVPVRLRGQTIGHMRVMHSDLLHRWTEDELAMAEATAERVAVSLESARLLEDAQERASREAFLSELSAKLGASFQLDSILRDTVEELGETWQHSTVTFQLVNPSLREAGSRIGDNGRPAAMDQSSESPE